MKDEVKICKCGCGKVVTPSSRDYAYGHRKNVKSTLCECGCGEFAKPHRRVINFHAPQINPMYGKHHTEEAKKIMSDKAIERYEGPDGPAIRKNLSDKATLQTLIPENNPNWQGGKSYEVYPQEWDETLRESIRIRDNHVCQNPNCEGKNYHRKLDVHHIDHNKLNCYVWNLIALCHGCNPKANHNKPYWRKLYQDLLAERGITQQ